MPVLCNLPRALQIADIDPYGDIVRYLKVHRDHRGQLLRTLSYFDGVNFSARADTPALSSGS